MEQCKNKDIDDTEENQRAEIGPLINLIRFPLIRPADFVKLIRKFEIFYKYIKK